LDDCEYDYITKSLTNRVYTAFFRKVYPLAVHQYVILRVEHHLAPSIIRTLHPDLVVQLRVYIERITARLFFEARLRKGKRAPDVSPHHKQLLAALTSFATVVGFQQEVLQDLLSMNETDVLPEEWFYDDDDRNWYLASIGFEPEPRQSKDVQVVLMSQQPYVRVTIKPTLRRLFDKGQKWLTSRGEDSVFAVNVCKKCGCTHCMCQVDHGRPVKHLLSFAVWLTFGICGKVLIGAFYPSVFVSAVLPICMMTWTYICGRPLSNWLINKIVERTVVRWLQRVPNWVYIPVFAAFSAVAVRWVLRRKKEQTQVGPQQGSGKDGEKDASWTRTQGGIMLLVETLSAIGAMLFADKRYLGLFSRFMRAVTISDLAGKYFGTGAPCANEKCGTYEKNCATYCTTCAVNQAIGSIPDFTTNESCVAFIGMADMHAKSFVRATCSIVSGKVVIPTTHWILTAPDIIRNAVASKIGGGVTGDDILKHPTGDTLAFKLSDDAKSVVLYSLRYKKEAALALDKKSARAAELSRKNLAGSIVSSDEEDYKTDDDELADAASSHEQCNCTSACSCDSSPAPSATTGGVRDDKLSNPVSAKHPVMTKEAVQTALLVGNVHEVSIENSPQGMIGGVIDSCKGFCTVHCKLMLWLATMAIAVTIICILRGKTPEDSDEEGKGSMGQHRDKNKARAAAKRVDARDQERHDDPDYDKNAEREQRQRADRYDQRMRTPNQRNTTKLFIYYNDLDFDAVFKAMSKLTFRYYVPGSRSFVYVTADNAHDYRRYMASPQHQPIILEEDWRAHREQLKELGAFAFNTKDKNLFFEPLHRLCNPTVAPVKGNLKGLTLGRGTTQPSGQAYTGTLTDADIQCLQDGAARNKLGPLSSLEVMLANYDQQCINAMSNQHAEPVRFVPATNVRSASVGSVTIDRNIKREESFATSTRSSDLPDGVGFCHPLRDGTQIPVAEILGIELDTKEAALAGQKSTPPYLPLTAVATVQQITDGKVTKRGGCVILPGGVITAKHTLFDCDGNQHPIEQIKISTANEGVTVTPNCVDFCENDMAIIRFPPSEIKKLEPTIRNNRKMRMRQPVIGDQCHLLTMQYGKGDSSDPDFPLCAVSRAGVVKKIETVKGMKHFAYTCQSVAGDSGSPVVNHDGQLIGIHARGCATGGSYNYFVPIDQIHWLAGVRDISETAVQKLLTEATNSCREVGTGVQPTRIASRQ